MGWFCIVRTVQHQTAPVDALRLETTSTDAPHYKATVIAMQGNVVIDCLIQTVLERDND